MHRKRKKKYVAKLKWCVDGVTVEKKGKRQTDASESPGRINISRKRRKEGADTHRRENRT